MIGKTYGYGDLGQRIARGRQQVLGFFNPHAVDLLTETDARHVLKQGGGEAGVSPTTSASRERVISCI